MLKEALQYILDGMRPETQDLCGRAYVITPSGAQEVIETPIVPATLQLHSLDSIVKMIRTEAIHLADANTPALFVNIPSPTNVTCFSQPDFTQRCVRAVFYSASATDVPGWDAKVTLGFEEAQIALRTRFQETGDSLYAMKLVNDISLGAKVIYNDNGVATTVTTKSGVSLQTNEAIRPIVKLRPYRTFQEVEQPESTFLIRINDRGISFIEADGGMWRLTARNTIKAFLEENLAAEIESGKLVVMTTQVPNEGSDLTVYHVGGHLKSTLRLLEAYDMTTEAAVAKLMWIMGQTREFSEVERLFYQPVAQDILRFGDE